jgi:outer membrane protein TolC
VEQLHLNGLLQDIQLDVALIYLEVYERKANLEVALNNYETLQKIFQDGKNRLDAGLIDNNELLRFKVDLDNSELLVDAARAGLEKSVELLGRTIGKTVTLGQLGFSEFQQIPAPKDLERNITLMLTERSELLVLDKLTDASRMAMKVEQSEYYPKVDLVGSYTNYDYDLPNNNGSVNEDELRAQLVFSINLYQGGVTEAAVARSRLETLGLQYDRKELSDTLVTDLRNLHTDFTVNLRNVDVALVSIEQAEENLRISRLRYNEGLQRESDLLDAVTNLSRAHYNYVTVVQTVFSNHFRIMRMVESF